MDSTVTIAIKQTGLEWLESAPIAWDKKLEALDERTRYELVNWLDSICERAARLSGYIEVRGANGTGDHGHAAGVKESNTKACKVRKALGFTYPRQDLSF